MTKPIVLCILDGVGIAPDSQHNAVTRSKMPFLTELFKKYPHAELDASGAAVGLTPGTMGNSEVGHITIGAGRIVNQFLRRFQLEQESGGLEKNPRLTKFISDMKNTGGTVHMLGMISDRKVHSDISQQIDVLRIILDAGVRVCVHFFADGRDSPPKSAERYANELMGAFVTEFDTGQIWFGTLAGRYYAMDRNNNWNRTQIAFDAIAFGRAEFSAPNINAGIKMAYDRGETDEFIKPTIITSKQISTIRDGDGILFANYRSDRARQILKALVFPTIPEVNRPTDYTIPNVLCFSQYGMGLDELCPALIPDIPINNTLGDILSAEKLTQLRIAETEKYNHVTFFFDAERTIDYPGEEKILIPSPAVATFDLKPEMAAVEITDALLSRLSEFDAVILNYANGDMVGHTGIMGAATRAMETLDTQLARLVPAVLNLDGTILITSDHGNIEDMWDESTNSPRTAHTTNRVPFIIVGNNSPAIIHDGGGLSNIAPTILKMLGLSRPAEMTGHSLV